MHIYNGFGFIRTLELAVFRVRPILVWPHCKLIACTVTVTVESPPMTLMRQHNKTMDLRSGCSSSPGPFLLADAVK